MPKEIPKEIPGDMEYARSEEKSEAAVTRALQRDRAQERIPMNANVTGAGETSKDSGKKPTTESNGQSGAGV